MSRPTLPSLSFPGPQPFAGARRFPGPQPFAGARPFPGAPPLPRPRSRPGPRRARRAGLATLATGAALLGLPPAAHAGLGHPPLPLGDADLVETRSTRQVTRGVTLTRIERGTEPAATVEEIETTTRGPWLVTVLTIDPRRARGHLRTTYGPDVARSEPVTELVAHAGALLGVNGSFFTYTKNPEYPGEPTGLHLSDGSMASNPSGYSTEYDLVVDARTSRVHIGRFGWTGSVTNRRTHGVLPLEFLNHPPVVPAECTDLADQTLCAAEGDVVRFTREFSDYTPAGAGVEVILDRRGCVRSVSASRGAALGRGQVSLQATGRDSAALLGVARGCLGQSIVLHAENGRRVPLRPGLFGVSGRHQLLRHGRFMEPEGATVLLTRHPRTVAGVTRSGKIMLAAIDGRRYTNVGTTFAETAAVARALGMDDAVNLDGGHSTTMVVEGTVVNNPSVRTLRPVGDAVVFVEGPYEAPTRHGRARRR